jgi:hypothetical protein
VSGADAIQNFASGFTFARVHFIQTALNAAQGINQIVRAQSARFQPANTFADGMPLGFMQSRLHAVKNEFAWQRCQMGTRRILKRVQFGKLRQERNLCRNQNQ